MTNTMGPWKVGKQVVKDDDRSWCVVTSNPIAGRPGQADDVERYGGHPVARNLTLEDARLVAVAPEMGELASKCSGWDDDTMGLVERIRTGMPV